MKKIVNSLILIAILSIAALADIAPPKTASPTPKGKQVELFVDVTSEVTEPTLVIKKSSTKLLRAALDEAEGIESNLAQTESTAPNFTASTSTIVGGMLLTFAFVFGGVWLARNKKPSKTTVGLFLLGILGATTIFVTANVAPPQNLGINKNLLSPGLKGRDFAKGKVHVKIVNGNAADSDIKLLIPSNEE